MKLVLPKAELSKWYKIAILFLAPVLIIYFGFVYGNLDDGLQLSDFVPNPFVMGAVAAYILNEILAYLKRIVETK